MDQKLDLILKELQNLNQRQDRMDERLGRMEERQERMEQKQNVIYQQTGKLTEYHTESMGRFNHIDRQLRLLEADYDLVHRKTSETEKELHRLKQTKQ